MIDPFVRCWDGKYSYRETIEHAISVAKEQGMIRIFDVSDVFSENDIQNRLKLVPDERNYGLFIRALSDEVQLREAVRLHAKYSCVVGIFLDCSEVVKPGHQQRVFKILAGEEYRGVLAVHCERQDLFVPEKWVSRFPGSWNVARPKQSEIECVRDQIGFAKEAWFKGNLHICHVSCAESVRAVCDAKDFLKISCSVDPMHVMFNSKKDILYKVDPALREEDDRIALLQAVRAGDVDLIESNHDPKALGEKLFPPYLSGFPGLYMYKGFVNDFLPRHGVDGELIKRMTYSNIKRIFN